MSEVERLRDIAQDCRKVAQILSTRPAIERMLGMARDYDRRAERIERSLRVCSTSR
jgi:hypothetical protein